MLFFSFRTATECERINFLDKYVTSDSVYGKTVMFSLIPRPCTDDLGMGLW